jgi:fluoride ion exporter CrcB/FEX
MVGFLGGYTTFSSYSYEVLRLLEDRVYLLGALYLFGSPSLGSSLLGGGRRWGDSFSQTGATKC